MSAAGGDLLLEDRHRVFVSYSRRDFYIAEQLAVALRRRGLAVWFDVHELAAGKDWSAAIDAAIVECDSFVVVASRAALESSYVKRERDRAAQLGRPQVAVLAERRRLSLVLSIPAYDLVSSFGRGVGALAGDLAAGRLMGRRPRIRLPYPGTARLVALALALCVVFAIVLAVQFARAVVGHEALIAPNADGFVAITVGAIALVGVWPAAVLWAFLGRRVTWQHLRGWLFGAPLMALAAYVAAEEVAGYVTTGPLWTVIEQPDTLGDAPVALALLAALASVVAALATEFASGVCRFLRTGTAPRRVRKRHIGAIPRPAGRRDAVRSYRLLAADEDAGVADEIRRGLAKCGIDQVADGGAADRDIVVLTDKTPAGWLSRDDLRLPLAVVATSIRLPVRGVLHRFQWVDYRARRGQTLRALGRDLAGASDPASDARAAPAVPERLQQRRLPLWVTTTDWMLCGMAVLAALVAAYPAGLLAFTDLPAHVWPSVLCIAAAPVLVLLARWVRRRRITLPVLLGAMALCWVVIIACGLDGVLQEISPSSGHHGLATAVGYPAISAVVIALAWRSLRRWLPRRARMGAPAEPALGSVRGSLAWLTIIVSVLTTAVTETFITIAIPKPVAAAPPATLADVCRDRAGLEAFSKPFNAANSAVQKATGQAFFAAFEHRIQVKMSIVHELERYKPSGRWGEDMKTRLIAGLERTVRADQAVIRHEITAQRWGREYDEFNRAADDLAAPIC